MARMHNFSAGPAVLPEPVIRAAQEALWELDGSGVGVCGTSHRWPLFEEGVLESAKRRLRALLQLAPDQHILFLQGGAQTQFFQVPMNILRGGRATYLHTGQWSKGAIGEAQRFGTVDVPFAVGDAWNRVPQQGEWGPLPEGTAYLHYTSNNTIAGTQYGYVPDSGDVPLFCDMSSDIVSRPLDCSGFDLIYAGAQKNLGPSGVTLVVVRDSVLERCDPDIPKMLRYPLQVQKNSMLNTPNTFGIFVIERMCRWIEDEGGLTAIARRNERQSALLYDTIDGSGFWQGKADVDSRSHMNVTFTTGKPDLDTRFWKEAEAKAGLKGLKGHRVVGGLRATIYNAQTDEAVAALASFMQEFEREHG